MIWEDLDKKLIHLQAEAGHANDIFDQLGTCFINEGYSRSDYVEALKQREAQFPTGLDINGFGVAIPHTDAGYVLHETEGIMTLKHPVTFIQMGSDDTQVEVKVVFMLAIEDPKNHIKKQRDSAYHRQRCREDSSGLQCRRGHRYSKTEGNRNRRRKLMKSVNILSICGSGTVTSSMVAAKLKDRLSEHGYQVSATEAKPTEALNLAQSKRFDIIAHTSPLPKGDYGIPCVNAFACITGMGEDKFFEDFLKALQSIGK